MIGLHGSNLLELLGFLTWGHIVEVNRATLAQGLGVKVNGAGTHLKVTGEGVLRDGGIGQPYQGI